MNDKNLHIGNLEEKSGDFFAKGQIGWEKSEAEIWKTLSAKMGKIPSGKKVSMVSVLLKYAAAAIVFILVGLGSATFFYSKTVVSLPGEHVVASLPDGSTVEMNAGSSLTYYPLKWQFQRKLNFHGEGFFSVQKGKKFEVESENGNTQVLGTTFNIFSRDDKYRVTCLTGLVKVTSKTDDSVVLKPDSHAEIEGGRIILNKNYSTEKVVGWKNNQFFFAGTSLNDVIDEIERQYGVTIQIQPELVNRNFVGNFNKQSSVEEVLDFVCKTMEVKFVKQAKNVFLIVEKS